MFRKSLVITLSIVLVLCFLLVGVSSGMSREDKKALLLVAFGTSYEDASSAIKNVFELAKKEFPELEVRLAYASSMVRKALEKKGQKIDGPVTALAKLVDEGFNKVAVQPLFVIPGITYDYVASVCQAFSAMKDIYGRPVFEELYLGRPLLEHPSDYEEVVQALQEIFAPTLSKEGTALVLMGHGSEHSGGAAYSMLYLMLQKEFGESVFLGTVEGFPSFEDVVTKLEAQKVKKVVLAPFMLVAGDHALNDLAGEHSDSWKVQLKQRGFLVSTVLKGLGEYDAFARIFVERAKEVVEKL
ncbi:sirohydrochlorin cobaltochelatase [Atrimonas thermophila]|uniref:sirohydrochlorin cobaltochelatase n=1 Tax=Atrimonas thermophila TaxID=3064161 RepID=UPI00399CAB80